MQIALQLLIATLMVVATVMVHAVGIARMSVHLRSELTRVSGQHHGPLSSHSFKLTVMVVLGLFLLHGVEIWLYALLFHSLGAVADIETALYFSTITYGTVGYNDDELAKPWRLLAAIEGINGVILIGWSTAFFVTLMNRLARRR